MLHRKPERATETWLWFAHKTLAWLPVPLVHWSTLSRSAVKYVCINIQRSFCIIMWKDTDPARTAAGWEHMYLFRKQCLRFHWQISLVFCPFEVTLCLQSVFWLRISQIRTPKSKSECCKWWKSEMADDETIYLKWNQFNENLKQSFREFNTKGYFFDVTLACEKKEIKAHKLILSACSPFFSRLLLKRSHEEGNVHHLIYLKAYIQKAWVHTVPNLRTRNP